MQAIATQAFFDANTDSKRKRDRVLIPMPWPEKKKEIADVTPEERAALTAQLEQYSAFAH